MHFSIPDTQLFNVNGSSYMGYNIHINGAFHCTLRFRQLHCLHEQLRKEYSTRLPSFPSKKLLPLSLSQLEDRRSQLERYLQLVGQDSVISKCELLNNFLLTAQHESNSETKPHTITLDIHLPHGLRKKLTSKSTASTFNVLRQICADLTLPEDYRDHFTLYIARVLKDGDLELIRRLQNFESPYLSLRLCSMDCGVYLRRAFWDYEFDERVLNSETARGLLYVQAVGDIERGWLMCKDNEIRMKLDELQKNGFTKEYLQVVRSLPNYGCIRFRPCVCDYPGPGSICSLTLGPRAISLTIHNNSNNTNNISHMKSNSTNTSIGSHTSGSGMNTTLTNTNIVSGMNSNTNTSVSGTGINTSVSGINTNGTNGIGIGKGGIEIVVFPVTRVRCWRLTTVHGTSEDDMSSSSGGDSSTSTSTSTDTTQSQSQTRLEFAFEYLVSRDNLRWVTVSSDQAALMSASLQSVVDELVVKRQGVQNTEINEESKTKSKSANWCYLNRDGGFVKFQENTTSNSNNGTKENEKNNGKTMTKYSSVSFQNRAQDSVQNEAFEDIGDDDL